MAAGRFVLFVLAGLFLAGCTSKSALDGLLPSLETTSSIARPDAAVPAAAAGPDEPAAVAGVAEREEYPAAAIAMLPQARPAVASARAAGVIQQRRFRDA